MHVILMSDILLSQYNKNSDLHFNLSLLYENCNQSRLILSLRMFMRFVKMCLPTFSLAESTIRKLLCLALKFEVFIPFKHLLIMKNSNLVKFIGTGLTSMTSGLRVTET